MLNQPPPSGASQAVLSCLPLLCRWEPGCKEVSYSLLGGKDSSPPGLTLGPHRNHHASCPPRLRVCGRPHQVIWLGRAPAPARWGQRARSTHCFLCTLEYRGSKGQRVPTGQTTIGAECAWPQGLAKPRGLQTKPDRKTRSPSYIGELWGHGNISKLFKKKFLNPYL